MLLTLDFSSDIPIYMQIRNEIMMGISMGKLTPGEQLPTIRRLAEEVGVNTMTVNKAYQLLKQEGYITADRRSGAIVNDGVRQKGITEKLRKELHIVLAEAKLQGASLEDIITLCKTCYEEE